MNFPDKLKPLGHESYSKKNVTEKYFKVNYVAIAT